VDHLLSREKKILSLSRDKIGRSFIYLKLSKLLGVKKDRKPYFCYFKLSKMKMIGKLLQEPIIFVIILETLLVGIFPFMGA